MVGDRAQSAWLMLQPRPDYLDHVEPGWLADAVKEGILCASCKRRQPQSIGRPLHIVLREQPVPRPFGATTICLIARRDFADALNAVGQDLLEGYAVGSLSLAYGRKKEAAKYVTLSPRGVIAIRGAGASGKGCCCINCRRFHYFPMPWESRHLIKGAFDESRRLHATRLGDLVVRAEIWDQIPAVFKRKIKAWPLPVKEEPEDGIEDFPAVWP